MENRQKNRLLLRVLLFLVIVNLAALATWAFYPFGQESEQAATETAEPQCIYKARLQLTDDQTAEVNLLSEDYRERSAPLAGQIRSLRGEILDELSSDRPDTSHLNRLTLELSGFQAQLQRENIRHYMALKEVCTPGQAMRLSNLYRELYGCPMQEGQGMRHRHGRR